MNTELTQQQKQLAHGMIERLAPEKLSAVVGLLEVMLDPFDRALATAELDDEPVTEEELRDIEASREWFKHNQGTPFEQLVSADSPRSRSPFSRFRSPLAFRPLTDRWARRTAIAFDGER